MLKENRWKIICLRKYVILYLYFLHLYFCTKSKCTTHINILIKLRKMPIWSWLDF